MLSTEDSYKEALANLRRDKIRLRKRLAATDSKVVDSKFSRDLEREIIYCRLTIATIDNTIFYFTEFLDRLQKDKQRRKDEQSVDH